MTILPAGRGQIRIACPTEVINFARKDIRPVGASHPNTVKGTLAGLWRDFPDGRVWRLDALARLDGARPVKEYKWFEVPVEGEAAGGFSGDIFLNPANNITPVSFLGIGLAGQPLFKTGIYNVWSQLADEPRQPDDGETIITFPEPIRAGVSRAVSRGRLDKMDGKLSQLSLSVRFDVRSVPIGTIALWLAFRLDGGEPLVLTHDWRGKGQYDFDGVLTSPCGGVLDHPVGETFSLGTVLKAMGRPDKELVQLAALRGAITLYQNKK